jgi:hypothetical protein
MQKEIARLLEFEPEREEEQGDDWGLLRNGK